MSVIKNTRFIKSSTKLESCPKPLYPEYAFLGRSNVGKSSLLNMLVNNKKFARISSTPGKTSLINHFLINNEWYLVDLPGYGYAKTSKVNRENSLRMITDYLINRKNLICLFILLDCRHEPQSIDMEFMEWTALNKIPFVICFTKTDKLSIPKLNKRIDYYKKTLLKSWESLPDIFFTSSEKKTGREEILSFIIDTNKAVNI